jgi:tetratricopeptide (TPR) repeat protein
MTNDEILIRMSRLHWYLGRASIALGTDAKYAALSKELNEAFDTPLDIPLQGYGEAQTQINALVTALAAAQKTIAWFEKGHLDAFTANERARTAEVELARYKEDCKQYREALEFYAGDGVIRLIEQCGTLNGHIGMQARVALGLERSIQNATMFGFTKTAFNTTEGAK